MDITELMNDLEDYAEDPTFFNAMFDDLGLEKPDIDRVREVLREIRSME